jgi:hypothetical protein
MTFRDPYAHLNAALDRANKLLTTQYTPEIVFDAKAPPALDTDALRKALHAALAALDDADDAEGADDGGSFTEVRNREPNHRTGKVGSGTFTAATDRKRGRDYSPFTLTGEDASLAMDERQQRAFRASTRAGAIDSEFREMLGSAAAHRRDWQ